MKQHKTRSEGEFAAPASFVAMNAAVLFGIELFSGQFAELPGERFVALSGHQYVLRNQRVQGVASLGRNSDPGRRPPCQPQRGGVATQVRAVVPESPCLEGLSAGLLFRWT